MHYGGDVMGRKLEKLSRYIEFHTDEELESFREELLLESLKRDKNIDDEERWLDEEFNRIFVTYAYADVTRMM